MAYVRAMLTRCRWDDEHVLRDGRPDGKVAFSEIIVSPIAASHGGPYDRELAFHHWSDYQQTFEVAEEGRGPEVTPWTKVTMRGNERRVLERIEPITVLGMELIIDENVPENTIFVVGRP